VQVFFGKAKMPAKGQQVDGGVDGVAVGVVVAIFKVGQPQQGIGVAHDRIDHCADSFVDFFDLGFEIVAYGLDQVGYQLARDLMHVFGFADFHRDRASFLINDDARTGRARRCFAVGVLEAENLAQQFEHADMLGFFRRQLPAGDGKIRLDFYAARWRRRWQQVDPAVGAACGALKIDDHPFAVLAQEFEFGHVGDQKTLQ